MIIIRNNILPIGKKYVAMNLCGILFVKKGVRLTDSLINHERIHTAQMLELLVVPFYVIYVVEWLVRTILNGFNRHEAYLHTSFEREAYTHDSDLDYLKKRKHFAEWR